MLQATSKCDGVSRLWHHDPFAVHQWAFAQGPGGSEVCNLSMAGFLQAESLFALGLP